MGQLGCVNLGRSEKSSLNNRSVNLKASQMPKSCTVVYNLLNSKKARATVSFSAVMITRYTLEIQCTSQIMHQECVFACI